MLDFSEAKRELQTAQAVARRNPMLLDVLRLAIRLSEPILIAIVGFGGLALTARAFDLGRLEQYIQIVWFSVFGYALLAELLGAYDTENLFSFRRGWVRVTSAWFGVFLGLILLAFFLKTSSTVARSWAGFEFLGIAATLTLGRVLLSAVVARVRRRGTFNQRLAILGCHRQAAELFEELRSNANLTIDLIGCFEDEGAERHGVARLQYIGDVSDLVELIQDGLVDQVIVTLPRARDELEDVIARLAQLPVLIRVAPDLGGFRASSKALVSLGGTPLLTVFDRPISGFDLVLKRVEDLTIGVVLLIAIAPLTFLVALAIKLDSRGPVFFRQAREGFNHRQFRIWKFRTMRVAECQEENIRQTVIGDARVTRVGRLLRATSIDELPQLFNVLAGDMSLVGPRPHAPSTKVAGRLFKEAIDDYAARHRVKPGMTGWAQVNGWRGETNTDEKLRKRVECDLHYIERWSLGFDLYILVKTIDALLRPKSAY